VIYRKVRGRRIGYDYVHTVIDDHSRVAYAEIHDDEKGTTAAGVLERTIAFYARLGVSVERVISDNALAYRHSAAFRAVIDAHGITQKFIRPTVPGPTGKSNASTAPSPPNGPTPEPGPRTRNAPQPCPPGSTTAT